MAYGYFSDLSGVQTEAFCTFFKMQVITLLSTFSALRLRYFFGPENRHQDRVDVVFIIFVAYGYFSYFSCVQTETF